MKNTIRYFIFSVLIMVTLEGYSQRKIQYTQFQQTAILYNPGFTGIEDFIDIKVGFRKRWAGMDPSPQSGFALGSVALKTSTGNKYKRRSVRLVEPEAYHKLETPEEFQYRKGKRHGVGAAVLTDQNDVFSSIGGLFSYAYHLPISKFLILDMGTSLSVFNDRIDGTNLTVLQPDIDPVYQLLNQGQYSNTNLYMNFGTVLYSFKFYLGYSANNLFRSTISSSDGLLQPDNKMVHNIMFGWMTFPRYGYVIVPSVMAEIVAGGKADVIVGLRGKYEDKIWAGLTYRIQDALGANIGLYITENIAFSYNFEYSLSAMSSGNYGNHEFILALKLNNKNYSRAYLW